MGGCDQKRGRGNYDKETAEYIGTMADYIAATAATSKSLRDLNQLKDSYIKKIEKDMKEMRLMLDDYQGKYPIP